MNKDNDYDFFLSMANYNIGKALLVAGKVANIPQAVVEVFIPEPVVIFVFEFNESGLHFVFFFVYQSFDSLQ